jgi:hypothetical protein
MAFQLAPEEPGAGPWRAEPLSDVIKNLVRLGSDRVVGGRGMVLAIDGRSSSGKTTLAARLHDAVAHSALVHTDDIAWRHSRFGWSDLLIEGVLVPFRRQEAVSYRPPRWAEHGRDGAIRIPAACPVLIIEGVGVARAEIAPLLDAVVWVQADRQETERRSRARVGQPGGPRSVRHHRDWMDEEEPFLAGERPWERADVLVAGTPPIPSNAGSDLVVAPPLRS